MRVPAPNISLLFSRLLAVRGCGVKWFEVLLFLQGGVFKVHSCPQNQGGQPHSVVFPWWPYTWVYSLSGPNTFPTTPGITKRVLKKGGEKERKGPFFHLSRPRTFCLAWRARTAIREKDFEAKGDDVVVMPNSDKNEFGGSSVGRGSESQ